MPKKNKGSKKSSGVEYCRGYVDEHGQWNNGFYCPQWGGPGRKYCCGTDTHKVCCPKDDAVIKKPSLFGKHLPLVCGLVAACVVLLIILIVVICYFCRGCWVYRRRKRLQNGSTLCSNPPTFGGRTPGYTVSYSVCPHPPYLPDAINHSVCYPMDDPPPYPGEGQHSIDEKQPLNPSHLYVSMETSDDIAVNSDRRSTVPDIPDTPDTRGSDYDLDTTAHCQRCEPTMSQSSSAVTALVRDTQDENIDDINVSGDFDDLSSPGSCDQHNCQVILKDFINASTGEIVPLQAEAKYTTLEDLTSREDSPAPQSSSVVSGKQRPNTPIKSIEIGTYLRSIQTHIHQSSEESTDTMEALPTMKLLSEHGEEQPSNTRQIYCAGTGDATSHLSILQPVDPLIAMDDQVVQVIPQG